MPAFEFIVWRARKVGHMTELAKLKKWMLSNDISVVDLNWSLLSKVGITMQKLLHWEMHGTGARQKKIMEARALRTTAALSSLRKLRSATS